MTINIRNDKWIVFHTIECYIAIKLNGLLLHEPHKYQAECKKPDTKEYILDDFIYLKCKPGKK